jgi:threonine/homoserine/homoserine lactone efflux protein
MLLQAALKCVLFGITLAAAVGPIALLIVSLGARLGFGTAARAACGAALADFSYALLAFIAGAALLARLQHFETPIRIGGAVALLALAAWMLLGALRAPPEGSRREAAGDRARPFLGTYLLTLVNPMTIVVFVAFAAQLPLAGSAGRAPLLALCVAAGSLGVALGFACAGSLLSRLFARPARARLLQVGSAAGIMAFGIHGLLQV